MNEQIVGFFKHKSYFLCQKIEILLNIERNYMSKQSRAQSKQSIDQEKVPSSWSLFQGDTQLGKKVNQFLNGGTYAIITTLIMVYSLFSDDIRQIFFPLSADLGFSITTLICMIFYGIEIVVYSFVQKDYFLKYYFWLDVVSTLTMAFDLIWVTQYLTGGGKSAANISQISKASRAARLGTRTVRLIRLIRLIKLLKQMKQLTKDLAKSQNQLKIKKTSQRLSSIHSKIILAKQEQKINSLNHVERISSKRWSVLKDLQCLGAIQSQVGFQIPAQAVNHQTYEKKDEIIVKQQQSDSNNEKIQKDQMKEENKNLDNASKNVLIPVFEQTREISKRDVEYPKQIKLKRSQFLRSKRSKFEITNKKVSVHQAPTQQQIQIPPQSKVGSKVQEQVQKNIILLIILILISIPLLDGSTWYNFTTVYDKSQSSLMYYATFYPSAYQNVANSYISQATSGFLNSLLYFEVNTTSINDIFPDNYEKFPGSQDIILSNTRLDDILITSGSGYLFGYSIAWYNKVVSIFNIVRTFFVCILLIISVVLFSNDLDKIAVLPLQEMMQTVKKMATNPLNAIKEIELKKLCLEKLQEEEGKVEKTQPIVLQNTIVKIGSLLAVGFGEAGTEIICRVIEDPSIINVMIPGQKIMAIFGFCDIRNFTDATEVLQADVMVFVNQIAAICHKTVYEHLGSPNKNIGDAFLLVWKFTNQDLKITQTEEYTKLELVRSNSVSQKADLAVLALVRMIADMTRADCLQKYKTNKGLQQRIPNYAGVKMGFGLHIGWAIEGPIGSQYKIDASYLGPDVHMASRLQAATKGYGAHMLITDSVYSIMSQNKRYLRKIDQVVPEGESKMTSLYTVDLQPAHLFKVLGASPDKLLDAKQKRLMKIYQNNNRKKLEEDINIEGTTNALWNDEDIKIMKEQYSEKFYNQWKAGFDFYIEGRWQEALYHLTQANSLAPKGSDGPSQSLIKFIEEHNAKAPQDWNGYRGFQ